MKKTKPMEIRENRGKTLNILTKFVLLTVILLTASGCSLWTDTKVSIHDYYLHELGIVVANPKRRPRMTSNNWSDYILPDGRGIAIPAKIRYDYYISPFAPDRYILSKEPEGSTVICPYSGRALILGKRKLVKEKDPES